LNLRKKEQDMSKTKRVIFIGLDDSVKCQDLTPGRL